ncbi:MAG: phosphoribosylglycinamide formyltransferase [Pseudomonadales bacterium]
MSPSPQTPTEKAPTPIAVLASHRGSNFQAILDAIANGQLNATVVLTISNNSQSEALARAARASIPVLHLSGKTHPEPGELDQAMATALNESGAELVVTAGYMKKLGPITLAKFAGKVVNIHPSLLPKYGGQGMYGMRIHEAVIAAGDQESGLTIHLVDDEYDTGPILKQQRVPVLATDTAETLAERIIAEEHKLLVAALQELVSA